MTSGEITGEGRLLLMPRGVLWRVLIRQLTGAPEAVFKESVVGPFLVEVPNGLELPEYDSEAVESRLMNLLRGIEGSEAMVHDLAPRQASEPVVIGRSEQSADVILDSQVVSKRHAELLSGPGAGWRMRDLESANGTFCEGRRLPAGIPSAVESGELLRFTKWRGVLLSPDHLYTLAELATKQTTTADGGLSRAALRDTLRKRRPEPPRGGRATEARPRPAKPNAEKPRPKAVPRAMGTSGRIPKTGSNWDDAELHFRDLALAEFPAGPFLIELPDELFEGERVADAQARVSELKQTDLSGGRVFSLQSEPGAGGGAVLIGRVSCDVELGISEASRRHAKFQVGAVWKLFDLESANGTYVDGRKLPAGVATRVESGQIIKFSSLRFILLSRNDYHRLVHGERVTTAQDSRHGSLMRELLQTPREGLPLRELVEIVSGFKKDEFLRYCEARFLLQVPVVLPDEVAPEFAEDRNLGGTQKLSRTRILTLQRSKKISNAKVHTLYPPTDGGLTAGRHEDCDLVLDETSVSKQHAQFRHTKRGWHVVDMESHNGTFVEGKQVPAGVLVQLNPGTNMSLASYAALWLTPNMVHKLLDFVAKERGKK